MISEAGPSRDRDLLLSGTNRVVEPTAADQSNLPFHSQKLDFGLDYVEYLSPAQLGLAWIAHPDYHGSMAARAIRKAWARAREQATREGKIGRIIVTAGEKGDWPEFAAIDLNWSIPNSLENLRSEQLAALFFHPDATTVDYAEARAVFAGRRARGFGPDYRTPPPSPAPEPTQRNPRRPLGPIKSRALKSRWNFVPRLPPVPPAEDSAELTLRPVSSLTSSFDPPRIHRDSSPPGKPRLVPGDELLSRWRITQDAKGDLREDYRLNWGERIGVLQYPGAPVIVEADDNLDEVDELESEAEESSDDEPLSKRTRGRSSSVDSARAPTVPRAVAPTAFPSYRIPRQGAELPTAVLLQSGSAWAGARYPPQLNQFGFNPSGPPPAASPLHPNQPFQPPQPSFHPQQYTQQPTQHSPYQYHQFQHSPQQYTQLDIYHHQPDPEPRPAAHIKVHPARLAMMANGHPQHAAQPGSPLNVWPDRSYSTNITRHDDAEKAQPTVDPRRRPPTSGVPMPASHPAPVPVPHPPPHPGQGFGARCPDPRLPQVGPAFVPHDTVPRRLTSEWTLMVVQYMDPALSMPQVAAVLRGGERRELPAPAAISFIPPYTHRVRDCLVAYQHHEDAALAKRVLPRSELYWSGNSRPKWLKLAYITPEQAQHDWLWSELNPSLARQLQHQINY